MVAATMEMGIQTQHAWDKPALCERKRENITINPG